LSIKGKHRQTLEGSIVVLQFCIISYMMYVSV
jgi:hypothetical protein